MWQDIEEIDVKYLKSAIIKQTTTGTNITNEVDESQFPSRVSKIV